MVTIPGHGWFPISNNPQPKKKNGRDLEERPTSRVRPKPARNSWNYGVQPSSGLDPDLGTFWLLYNMFIKRWTWINKYLYSWILYIIHTYIAYVLLRIYLDIPWHSTGTGYIVIISWCPAPRDLSPVAAQSRFAASSISARTSQGVSDRDFRQHWDWQMHANTLWETILWVYSGDLTWRKWPMCKRPIQTYALCKRRVHH